MHWNVLFSFFVLTFLLAGKLAKCQGEDFPYLDVGRRRPNAVLLIKEEVNVGYILY
jgi:hypothetical protein